MSALAAPSTADRPARGLGSQQAPAGRSAAPPPALHVVPAPPWKAPLAPFILVSVTMVVVGLLGLLLLNTLVAQDSFQARALERESTLLREREQTLRSEVVKLAAPGVLAHGAKALGLVPANTPGFVRLSDGKVTGEPKAASAPPPPAAVAAAMPGLTLAPPVTGLAPAVTPPAMKTAPEPATKTAPTAAKRPAPTKPGAAPATKPAAKQAATKQPVAKPAATKPAAPKQAAPKQAAPKQAAPKQAEPKQAAPKPAPATTKPAAPTTTTAPAKAPVRTPAPHPARKAPVVQTVSPGVQSPAQQAVAKPDTADTQAPQPPVANAPGTP